MTSRERGLLIFYLALVIPVLGCTEKPAPAGAEIGDVVRDGSLTFSFRGCGGARETSTRDYAGAILDMTVHNLGVFPANLEAEDQFALVEENRVAAASIIAFQTGETLVDELLETAGETADVEVVDPGKSLQVSLTFTTAAPPHALEIHAQEDSPGILLRAGSEGLC